MAPTATQPIRTPSQPGGSISSTGPSLLPPQITQSPGFEAPRSAGRGARETDNAAQPAGNSDSSIRKTFWRDTFPKVINICGILGLLFALIFGITQWVAQDKSIAIAKESELVTLALSCSDEKIKYTSICQQFLDKYPNGPVISRPQMGDIAEAEKAFLQNMTSLKTASAVQKAGTVMRAYSFQPVIVPSRILIWGICFVVAWILLFHINIEFILVLGLFIYYRYQEYYLSDRARK
ncbi:hypothetical protein F4824DRAFT_489692 [Ustulina deusta]|nr:hypothetical protein F4824DRAFT_489692 [Ustulina deusta]